MISKQITFLQQIDQIVLNNENNFNKIVSNNKNNVNQMEANN